MLCPSSILVSVVGRIHTFSVRVITAFVVISLFGSPALHLRFFSRLPVPISHNRAFLHNSFCCFMFYSILINGSDHL